MLINEYRLTPIEEKDRKFLEAEMEKFFFGEGSQRPAEFKELWSNIFTLIQTCGI